MLFSSACFQGNVADETTKRTFPKIKNILVTVTYGISIKKKNTTTSWIKLAE